MGFYVDYCVIDSIGASDGGGGGGENVGGRLSL